MYHIYLVYKPLYENKCICTALCNRENTLMSTNNILVYIDKVKECSSALSSKFILGLLQYKCRITRLWMICKINIIIIFNILIPHNTTVIVFYAEMCNDTDIFVSKNKSLSLLLYFCA